MLPSGWSATLAAVDGSTASGIAAQIPRLPAAVTHIVVSTGGNDALANSDLLALPVRSTTEALSLFRDRLSVFEASYRRAVAQVLELGRDTTVCTIYNGNLPPREAEVARIALMTFNDVILRVAFEHGLRVVDLRSICDDPLDYANPIEPSGHGGRKIATAIARAVGALPDPHARASVLAAS
jgi:hypothetical protein